MRLAHMDFEHNIIFDDDKINIIQIENKKLYREVLCDIYNQINGSEEGKIVLSDNNKTIKMNKYAYYINDICNMDINDKKLQNKLYSQLLELTQNEEMYMDTCKLKTLMEKYLDKISSFYDIAIEYDEDIDLKSFLKIFNIRVEKTYDSLFEKLLDYISILIELLGIKMFFLINMKSYFDEEELELLYKEFHLRCIKIVMIESSNSSYKSDYENYYIIDKDNCELYK